MAEERRMQMFMAHLPKKEFDFLEEKIKLIETDYCISYENEPYEHFHFVAYITDTEYHNFCQNIFKKLYKLRGRAGRKGTPDEGKAKQYGRKLENIRDIDRNIQYILKDGCYRSNMEKEYIEKLFEQSFKKDQKVKHMNKLFEFLDEKHVPYDSENYCNQYKQVYCQTNKTILGEIYYFILKNKDIELSLSRTAINNYFLKYLRNTQLYSIEEKIRMALFFNNHF